MNPMQRSQGRLVLLAPLLFGLVVAPSAAADSSTDDDDETGARWFHDTLDLRLGAVFSFIDTDLDIPPRIDLEDELDLDDFAVQPTAELRWRFTRSRRHRLEVGYFSILRSGRTTLRFQFDLPPGRIPINVQVNSDLDIHVLSTTYGYSVLHDARKELGIFAGLDFIWMDATVKAKPPIRAINFDIVGESFGTPFPTAGAFFNWAFVERFALWTRFQYFGLEVGDIGGAIFRGNLRLQHDTFRHINFFLGYEFLGATASVDGQLDDLDFFSHGPTLGAVFRF